MAYLLTLVFLLSPFLIMEAAPALRYRDPSLTTSNYQRYYYNKPRATYNRHYYYKPYAQYNKGYQFYQNYPRYQYYFNDPYWYYYERAPGVYYYFRV